MTLMPSGPDHPDGAHSSLPVLLVSLPDMHRILQEVSAVRGRWHRQRLWQFVSLGLLSGGLAGGTLAVLRLVSGTSFAWYWIAGVVVLPSLAGLITGLTQPPSLREAARRIDREFSLKDRIQTALQFLTSRTPPSVIQQLQIRDTESCLDQIKIGRIVPVVAPQSWKWAVISATVAILLALISPVPDRVAAAVLPNAVISARAERTAEGLRELQEMLTESPDARLQEMMQQVNEHMQELHAAATDPKEALAALSELEASLQQMQQHLRESSTINELKKVGEALSLAEPLAAAGEALSKGNLQKAAAELSRSEMPRLDRTTEKSMTEKLEELAADNQNRSPKSGELSESIQKVARGLAQKNPQEFKEGMQGLSEESDRQAQSQKLSEHLKKQAQAMGESRSDFEGELRSAAEGQAQAGKRGGNQAGQGTADKSAGTESAKLKTGDELKLTGEDSGTGDSEIENTTSVEQNQEAVRQYRAQAGKYEALSESVLESESLPLGHRQTIRRYFELIRPQPSDLEAIDKAAGSESGGGPPDSPSPAPE